MLSVLVGGRKLDFFLFKILLFVAVIMHSSPGVDRSCSLLGVTQSCDSKEL